MVDGRWVLRVTDWGLTGVKARLQEEEEMKEEDTTKRYLGIFYVFDILMPLFMSLIKIKILKNYVKHRN